MIVLCYKASLQHFYIDYDYNLTNLDFSLVSILTKGIWNCIMAYDTRCYKFFWGDDFD